MHFGDSVERGSDALKAEFGPRGLYIDLKQNSSSADCG